MRTPENGILPQYQAHNTMTWDKASVLGTIHPPATFEPSTSSIPFIHQQYFEQKQQFTYETYDQYPKGTETEKETMPSQRIFNTFKKAAKLTIFVPFVVAINALPVAAIERYGWLSEEELQRGVKQQYEGPLHR